MKRGAIFDMDGTLFDTEKLYRQAWLDVAAKKKIMNFRRR